MWFFSWHIFKHLKFTQENLPGEEWGVSVWIWRENNLNMTFFPLFFKIVQEIFLDLKDQEVTFPSAFLTF